jgi:glutathione S-transferase
MILIGMFDSPFVRRVAVSMKLLGFDFEHRNWSVGKDQQEIRNHNPVGRVPALILDSGETLIESAAILDYLDELAGPGRALLPDYGEPRRRALKLMALAIGAVEKGLMLVSEQVFRPAEKHHQPWLDRCSEQMHGALRVLDQACSEISAGQWLLGGRLTQPDISVTCVTTYLREAAELEVDRYPALKRHVERCEALPEFRAIYAPFFAPQPRK